MPTDTSGTPAAPDAPDAPDVSDSAQPVGPRGLHAPFAAPVAVVHLDDQIVVLDKPAGLPVTPERTATAGATPPDTLTNRLWHHLTTLAGAVAGDPAAHRPLIVHRIDRDVSGVIVFARTAAAHRHLSQQFEAHTVRKTYLGIVAGRLDPTVGEIDLPLGPLPKPNHRTRGRIFVNAPGAKAAHTRYRTREQLPAHTLVELQPTTGRRHQLRVHLAAREHPLVGDPLYAKKQPAALWPAALTAQGQLPRVALHAERLQFRHPADDREVDFSVPLPPELKSLLNQFRTSDFSASKFLNT